MQQISLIARCSANIVIGLKAANNFRLLFRILSGYFLPFPDIWCRLAFVYCSAWYAILCWLSGILFWFLSVNYPDIWCRLELLAAHIPMLSASKQYCCSCPLGVFFYHPRLSLSIFCLSTHKKNRQPYRIINRLLRHNLITMWRHTFSSVASKFNLDNWKSQFVTSPRSLCPFLMNPIRTLIH